MADSQFNQSSTGQDGPDSTPTHCREPMSLMAPEIEVAATLKTYPTDQPAGEVRTRVLRCRCGFQMDAPTSA
jgi:hypothetical protein